MRSQQLANFIDRSCQCAAEFLVLKMDTHFINSVLPELIATFLVDRHIPHNGEFLRSWRNKNQNRVARPRLVHSQPLKFLPRNIQWAVIESSTLNEDAYLAGSFRFRIPDRLHDLVMIQFAEKFLRSHLAYQSDPAPPPPKLPPPPLNPLNPPPPPPPPEDQPPPPPIGKNTGPPPRFE